MSVNEAMITCFKADTIVYPINYGKGFRIESRVGNRKPIQYKKVIAQGLETNIAMKKTYIFLAEKILKQDKVLD